MCQSSRLKRRLWKIHTSLSEPSFWSPGSSPMPHWLSSSPATMLTSSVSRSVLIHEFAIPMLISLQSSDSASVRTQRFFTVLLYATAVLSCIRFIGCLWFLGRSGIMCCFTRRWTPIHTLHTKKRWLIWKYDLLIATANLEPYNNREGKFGWLALLFCTIICMVEGRRKRALHLWLNILGGVLSIFSILWEGYNAIQRDMEDRRKMKCVFDNEG